MVAEGVKKVRVSKPVLVRDCMVKKGYRQGDSGSLPDVDIDFQSDRRQEVKEYLERRYNHDGLQRVFSAGTFTTMKLKAALWREVYSGVMPDCTEEYQESMLWDNIWRKGSPYSFRERCAYGKAHGQSVVKMLVKRFVKRFAYTRQLRRYKIKKMFPKVMEVK